ncbi:MAG: TonB-dependent receptor [Bacteroidales bacterium]|nr:TonB-dependent receptor [Bacteroidales bacterium]MCF8386403.1 TonB-dependent receptor [Bacteroidales bacterium]MCF8397893.1 TonB-dependent receptor [Bacteroidales bacterium]
MRKYLLFSLTMLLLAQQTLGQERIVRGTVTDQSDGSTLPGVSIRIKGTDQGTVTDQDGKFSISVPGDSEILVFSFIGMKTLEKQIPASGVLDVAMESQQVGLDEVVVIGYGTVKKRDLTGSVSSVSSDELQEIPSNSFDQEIQGRISGVNVTQLSAQPGGATSIKIRGGNSIMAGTEPLYVVDGVIMEGDKNFSFIGSPSENGLSSINPNDIESIDVLKDASATAIYGARGANGVVIITTKRGKAGEDKISFEAYTGIQSKAKSIDVMNAEQFARLYDEAGLNANPNYTPKYPNPDSLGKGTDWQSEIYRDAPISSYQLSFSGGNEKGNYLLGAGYFSQDGIIHGSDFKRYSFRANLDRNLSKRIKIGSSIMYTHTQANTVPTSTPGGFFPGVVNTALIFSPILPVYDEDGEYTLTDPNADAWLDNPVAVTRDVEAVSKTNRLIGNFFLEYNLLSGLDFKSSFGLDHYSNVQDMYTPRYIYSGSWNDGQARFITSEVSTYLFENTMTYDKKFGRNHKLNVLGGITFQKDNSRTFVDIVTGFPNDILGYYGIENATNLPTIYSTFSESATASYLGRINYNLKEKYLLTLTGRVDGSSRFGKNKRYGFFPAAAIAWRASEEDFIRKLNVFSNLKFRLSYGASGNDRIPLYGYISTLAPTLYYFNNSFPGAGFAPDVPGNDNLGWETTRQFDLGLDIGFFRGRISITTDYYIKTTEDMLYNFSLPWTSGYDSFIKNIGSMRNKGFEFALNTTNFVGEFRWNTSFNFSTNKNEILDLKGRDLYINNDTYKLKIGDWSVIREGEEMGSFYGLVSDGIWQMDEVEEAAMYGAEPGDFKYVDLNNDGIINDQDKKIIGHALPDFTWGLSNDFSFKNFSLNIFIQGVHGNQILNSNRFELESGNGLSNASVDMLNRWTPENPSNEYPRANRDADYLHMSDRYLEDGSYIRLKTITLGYTLPDKALNFLKIQRARVYFTATNLLTITDYTGFDPEVGHFGKDNTRMGYDYGAYPAVKTYTFGIILNI